MPRRISFLPWFSHVPFLPREINLQAHGTGVKQCRIEKMAFPATAASFRSQPAWTEWRPGFRRCRAPPAGRSAPPCKACPSGFRHGRGRAATRPSRNSFLNRPEASLRTLIRPSFFLLPSAAFHTVPCATASTDGRPQRPDRPRPRPSTHRSSRRRRRPAAGASAP